MHVPRLAPPVLFATLALAACDLGTDPDVDAVDGSSRTKADIAVGTADLYPFPESGALLEPEAYPGFEGNGDREAYPESDSGRNSAADPLRDPTVRRFPIVISGPQPPLTLLLTPAAASVSATTTSAVGDPSSAAGSTCAGIVGSEKGQLVIDGIPFTFFGINAHFLLEDEFPEARMEPIVRDLAARGVGVVRVWFFHDQDPDRFERLLDIGNDHGVRFIVTLVDNVFKGRDWFGGEEDEKRFRPHLERTVARFKDRPEILFWELANEPNCGGDFDAECLDTIKDWLIGRSIEVRAIDVCHLVTTGMIGAGNFDFEHAEYRSIHRRDTIGVVSAHRRTEESREREIEIAEDLEKPIIYGEIYDIAFDDDCQPLDGGGEMKRRAGRVKDDLRDARRDGVDGYILWALAVGAVERPNGTIKHYCGPPDYELSDPVWQKLAEDPELLPTIPWRR